MSAVTLATLAGSTKQEVFDTVARGLAAQGFERAVDGTLCRYYDSYGFRCAAGQLMTEEEYHALTAEQRDLSWADLVRQGVVAEDNMPLICALQFAHDNAADPTELRGRLAQTAAMFELDPTALTEGHCRA